MTRPSSLNKNGHLTIKEREDRKVAVESMNEYPRLLTDPPTWLDQDAADEWQRIADVLRRKTPVSELDRAQIINHCLLVSQIKQATAAINHEGLLSESGTQSEYVKLRTRAINTLKAVDAGIGLTTQSRARLEINKAANTPANDTDPIEALLS